MFGTNGEFNLNFSSSKNTGYIYEAVYNKDGVLLTEDNSPINVGTYNYCSDQADKALHQIFDINHTRPMVIHLMRAVSTLEIRLRNKMENVSMQMFPHRITERMLKEGLAYENKKAVYSCFIIIFRRSGIGYYSSVLRYKFTFEDAL